MALSVVEILTLFSTALLVLSPSNALSCGWTFDPWTNKGSIASPGYPNGYYDNSHCTWVIRPSGGNPSIRLTFNTPFSLEDGYDFVKIFETSPSGVHQQKESYSGHIVPPTYTSTTNRVEITFTSDGSRVRQGFKLTWNQICGSDSSGIEGSITSPHYPNNYDDDSDCTWIINVPSDHTISITFHPPFHLEQRQDFLKIFETSPSVVRQQKESYSGDTVPPTYTSTTNRVEITFTSDGRNARQGFNLTWNRICGSVLSAAEGSIASPHYPNNYDVHTNCRWIINAPSDHTISITFHSPFYLEQRHDFLKIFETSPSGVRQQKESYSGDTVPPTYTSTTNRVEITFTSDGSRVWQGFKLTWDRICGSVSNATEGSITSPHYPNNYDDDSDCRWIINAPSDRTISITFHPPFHLEQRLDFLKIFETSPSGVRQQKESYSGHTVPPTYTSTTNRVEITFTSDGNRVRQGFKLTWSRLCASVFNAAKGSITSPHYPNNYDAHTNCRWIINAPSDRAISITFHSPFHLEQWLDFLRIYETSPSGVRQHKKSYSGDTVPPTYTSTTNRVEITFTSYESRVSVRQGFKLTWERVVGCGLKLQLEHSGQPSNIHSLLPDLTCTYGFERRHHCSYTFRGADHSTADNPTELCIGGSFHLICYNKYNTTIHVSSSMGTMEIGCSNSHRQQLCAPPYEDLVATYEGNMLCTPDMGERIVRFLAVYQRDFHDKNNEDDDDNDNLYSLFVIPVLALLIGCVYIGYRKYQGRNLIGNDRRREDGPSEMSTTIPSAPPAPERDPPPAYSGDQPPAYDTLFTVGRGYRTGSSVT